MRIWTGTSGFSYKEWKGRFYPEKLPARAMLSHYAGELPAVEINNTFYRLPKVDLLAKWAEQVPEDFRFSIKASRRITHFKRLGLSSTDETTYLVETCATLGPRLGVILFQLPPRMKKDAGRLAAFLDLLPDGTRAAFEFRNPSWFDDEVRTLLADRDFALVHADVDEPLPGLPPDTPWLPAPGAICACAASATPAMNWSDGWSASRDRTGTTRSSSSSTRTKPPGPRWRRISSRSPFPPQAEPAIRSNASRPRGVRRYF